MGMNRMILIGCLVTSGRPRPAAGPHPGGPFRPHVFFGLTIFMGLGNGICLPNANAGMLSVRPTLPAPPRAWAERS
jgi:MFS transporter, DHA1 family, multidrug resistance protein